MAEYTLQKNGETRRYRDGGKLVAADKVPEQAKAALEDASPGTIVDDLGYPVDPTTESDESENETLPTKQPEDDEADDQESRTQEQARKDGAQREIATRSFESAVPQDDEGMGFKRVDGKTVSIFSNKPHETVRAVSGVMVPLTLEEYENKTDAEIIEKLKQLKKL